MLFIVNDAIVCGGSLVSPTQIVSAAHCFADQPLSDVQAWAGVTNMSDRSNASSLSVKTITNHENDNPATYANDIALVTLSAPVPARLGATTIGLPVKQNSATWPALGTTAIVSGWGETDPAVLVASDPLQAATVQVLASPSEATCGAYGAPYLPAEQVCAGQPQGGVDACEGDSGGPLTVYVDGEPLLAGISSTGFGCAAEGYPGLYVETRATSTGLRLRVSTYQWPEEHHGSMFPAVIAMASRRTSSWASPIRPLTLRAWRDCRRAPG